MCKRFIVLLAVFGLLASTGSTVFSQENDEPCGAIALESGDSVTGSTAAATPDAGALFPNAPGVWYTIVGNRGVATVGTCGEGSAYDTALSVFTGSCAPATANTSTSGGDIWTGGDDFQFDYTEITGDFDVAIEMVDYSHDSGAGRWGKMGLMARRELTRESEFMQTQFHGPALDDVSRQAGRREHGVAGGGMYEIVMDGAGARPVYTRLTRRGNVFQSWWSAEAPADPRDDASWTAGHAEDRGTMPETVFVGFANSEHNSDGAIPQTVTYLSLNDDFNEINAFVGNDAGGGSGTAVAGLTAILSNDDACVRPGQCCLSSISWETEEDVTYYILVHGWNTDSGPYQLDVSLGEPGAMPVNPNGWIQAEAWNMLILDQDGGCGGGGVGRMAGDWTGFDLFDSDPQAGDQWDIDFGAVESRGWTLTAVAELPTWATTAFLNENGIAVNGQDDLVNFDAYVAALGANTDNLVAISTTYVENTTDEAIWVNFCTSSDDSIRADLNENLITNASACRGSAGNCQERNCATLLPGMNKITTHVWEGGGGFNMRFGLRTLTDQVINDANDLGIVFHGSGGGDLEGQAGGVAGCDIDFGIARNGWIQASGWNWMAPLLNPLGCGGGGQGVMGSNWVPPYDLGTEDPKAGDEWDIDFGASPSNGFNNGGLSDGPIWVTHAFVADNLGVELPDGDLVDFQGIAVTLQNAGIGGGIPNDNVMSIATTYVQNNTDSPLAVDICTASDDSVLTMLNCNIITNVSACRGSGGDCQERRPAVLLPGINKLSALVWEGGGGWNMRVAVEYNGVKVNSFPGIPEITLLGAGDADTVGQPTLCVARTATLSPNACPQASVPFQITGNGGGVAGDSVTVIESFGPVAALDAYTITDISNGGTIESTQGLATLNVGPNGVATQSSEGWGGAPGRAIDGNTDGQWGGGSVTHTDGMDSWWEVDLQASYYIESIRLWNRLDCCSERLANFTVQVLDIDRNVVFESAGLNANSAVNFTVPDVDADGQIVRVSIPEAFLSLAEVEIFSPTDEEVTTSVSIVWETTVADVNAGLSYTLAYSDSGSSSASGTFDLGGGPTPVDGISGVPFAADATGPIGDFDNSHLIGDANQGGVTYDADSDSYTVEANGSDIWNGGDHFAFAYKAVTGNFVATAHIADRIDGASGRWGKHGLMARQTCHSNARYSMIQTNLSGVNEAEIDLPRHSWRQNQGENGSSSDNYQVDDGALAGFDPDAGQRVNRRPTWMRMYRVGALIQTQLAFEDENGDPIQWQTIGGDSHPDRPDTLLVGLALTNHSGDVGSAVFDQVSIEAYDPGADESVRGDEIGPLDLVAGDPADSGLVVVQGGGYRPEVLDNGHLRITSNAVGGSANAVWLPQPLDLSSGFVLEFDAFMGPVGCDAGADPNPADGFTLTMIEAGGTGDPMGAWPSDLQLDSLRGDGGGAEGLWGNALLGRTEGHGSFSVEFDNWVGGFDPATGGSPNSDCSYHVGLLANTMVNAHVATNMDLGVGAADLPNLFTEEGVHVAVKYAPNGHVTVTLNDELVVIDSHVVPLSGDLILGFTGGTGGATADQEVANITLYELGAAAAPNPTFAYDFGDAADQSGGCAGATSSADVDVVLVTSDNPSDEGAQSYSLGVAASGGSITAISTAGTDAGGLIDGGFELSELTSGDGNDGAITAVILSFTQPVSLAADGSSSVATVTVESTNPDGADAATVSLEVVNGLVGGGRPVQSVVTWRGQTYRPSLGSTSYSVSSDVDAPAAPSGLAAVAGNNQVSLDWDDSAAADLASYTVSRDGAELASGLTESSYVDDTAVNDTSYSYTVTASDSCSESDASSAVEATPIDPGIGPFARGDSNGDGTVNISDPSATLNWLFLGGGDPPCLAAADANRDGSVNISDPSYTLRWLFLGGADHPAPSACGRSTDAGDMAQGCETATCAE